MKNIFSVLLFAGLLCAQSVQAENKQLLGYIEKVRIFPGNLMLHAKLAADVEVSAIHADNIEEFKKNGKTWVRFQIIDRFGKRHNFEEEVVRKVRIKGKDERRYTVTLNICVGTLLQEEQFSLTDRSAYDQEVLLGRGFMAGSFIIDPAKTFAAKPTCVVPKTNAKAAVKTKPQPQQQPAVTQ